MVAATTVAMSSTSGSPEVGGKKPFDKNEAKYCYVLVRKDLDAGYQVVQAIHSAMSAAAKFGACLEEDTRLVMLSVNSEDHLLQIADELEENGIEFSIFSEPDYDVGFSSLTTKPSRRINISSIKKLKLWKMEQK